MAEAVHVLDAVRAALVRAMVDDPAVVLVASLAEEQSGLRSLGERVGRGRVLDLPDAAGMLVGVASGLAVEGFRPVVECAPDEIVTVGLGSLARLVRRPALDPSGPAHCPVVVRVPYGPPGDAHDDLVAAAARIAGVRVVVPSSPSRAHGLLLGAIRDSGPVVFLEPRRLHRAPHERIDHERGPLAIGSAHVVQPGHDVTVVSWGGSMVEALAAAHALDDRDVSAEVIDLSTVWPVDVATIAASVRRTGRCVIVQEGSVSGGVGAEVAAQLADAAITSLLAPVVRVMGHERGPSAAQSDSLDLLAVQRVLAACHRVLEFE